MTEPCDRFVVPVPEPAPVAVYIAEGWWHPNVKSGQVHDHPEDPSAYHRLCEQVYTKRPRS